MRGSVRRRGGKEEAPEREGEGEGERRNLCVRKRERAGAIKSGRKIENLQEKKKGQRRWTDRQKK